MAGGLPVFRHPIGPALVPVRLAVLLMRGLRYPEEFLYLLR
jgi:hypothetical protein